MAGLVVSSAVYAQFYSVSTVAGGALQLGTAVSSSFLVSVPGVVWDSTGRFYFSYGPQVFRVNTSGVVDMVIGNGVYGLAGDGSPATSSTVQLALPQALATDSSNNLYIVDSAVGRIRRVGAASGLISTVAGNGTTKGTGSTVGEGGPATAASLFGPSSVAIDATGNLYIAETNFHRVRRVDAVTGVIATVAGKGTAFSIGGADSGDGGLAVNANVTGPTSVALDGAGNLYIADSGARVRKVTAATGVITTFAGNGTTSATGDNGAATSAGLGLPTAIQFDSGGNLYISSYYSNLIRKVTPAGIISTFAGTDNTYVYSGEGGPASLATFYGGGQMSIDSHNNLLYSSAYFPPTGRILKMDGATTTVTTLGGGTASFGDGGAARNASFAGPDGIAVDSAGNLFVGDSYAQRVKKISAATGIISNYAGNGGYVSSGDGGPAATAGIALYSVTRLRVATDPAGNVYISDSAGKVRKVTAQTGIISTAATTQAQFAPWDMIADASGVYVSDRTLTRLDASSKTLVDALPATQSGLGSIDRDASGAFFFSGSGNVSKIAAGQSNPVIVAGNCSPNCPDSTFYTGAQLGDGGPAVNAIIKASAVKLDHAGNIYIADAANLRVRMVSAATGIITTIGGSNVPGCSGARFTSPSQLAVDAAGNVYVLDSACRQIFKLTPDSGLTGNLESVGCQTITGWAADRSRPNVSITVSVYDGATLLTTITANQARPEIGAILSDNGLHGFSFTAPAGLRDGRAHNIRVVYETGSSEIPGSPQALTCASYTGNVDSSSCTAITGWAADAARLNQSITVTLWDGATQIASTTANQASAAAATAVGDNGLHGFTFVLPAGVRDGAAHSLQVRYETSTTQVSGSPVSLTCVSALPTVNGTNPAAGSGLAQTFTFSVSSPSGYQGITLVNALINNFVDGRRACYLAVVPSSGTVYLVNDAGDAGGPYAGMSLPGSGTVQNSQCSISGNGSSISGSGNNLTVTLNVTFNSSFAGNRILFTAAQSTAGNTGWQIGGTWNVPGAPVTGPTVVGATLPHGTAASGTYAFTFADSNGLADLAVANVLINSSIDGRHACYVAYAPTTLTSGTLYLVNDAGDASGPYSTLTLPGSGIIRNSQCTISGSGSAVTTNGNTMTLNLNMNFTNFGGNRVIYAASRSGTTSSDWQAIGFITLP